MKTPRLTIFSAVWDPIEGGAEKQLREVAELMSIGAWRVTVVAGISSDLPRTRFSPAGVRVLGIPPKDGISDGQTPRSWDLAFRMVNVGLSTRPDVVLGSLVSNASYAAMTTGRLLGVPRALRLGGRRLDASPRSKVEIAKLRFLVRSSNAIVANARHLLADIGMFRPRPGTRITVIPNGVAQPARILPRPEPPPRVLYYTNGGPKKNDEAFVSLVRMRPGTSFRAVGRTDHLPSLHNLDKRGWVRNLSGDFGWSNVVVNTSLTEGSPNFCLQALASGRFVVGFDNAGVLELASQWPDWVFSVPINNVSDLASTIEFVVGQARQELPEIPSMGDVSEIWDRELRALVLRGSHSR